MANTSPGQSVVIDASLALKWELNDEEHVENALAIRDSSLLTGYPRLLAPSLFVYEVVNGLAVAGQRLKFDPRRASKCCDAY